MRSTYRILVVFLVFQFAGIAGDSANTNDTAYKTGFYTNRMPWEKEYQEWMNKQFILKERYRENSMDAHERQTYREWLIYRKVLSDPEASMAKRYNAWRRYVRRVDRWNVIYKKYPEVKIRDKNIDQDIMKMMLDF